MKLYVKNGYSTIDDKRALVIGGTFHGAQREVQLIPDEDGLFDAGRIVGAVVSLLESAVVRPAD